MKRVLTMILMLSLALALGVPALAETERAMDDALTEITVLVKEALEIDDAYTDFSGNYGDGLRPGWYLNWSDEGRDLSVTCDAEGVITEVYRWEDLDGRNSFYGFDAHFPDLSAADARARAEYWLARLMGPGESARIDGFHVTMTADGVYRFYGRVRMNGLESPVSFTIAVGGAGLVSYSRSDGYAGYVGGVPDKRSAVKRSDAAAALAEAMEFELYYVTDADGTARLRYVPSGPYTVVDAATGEAVDMDALYASFGGTAHNGPEAPAAEESAMAADSGGGRGLTEAELSSIANYKDVLPQEKLDQTVRALGDLGLADFTLARCSYRMDGDGNVIAALRYTCDMTADNLFGYSLASYWSYLDGGGTPAVTKYIEADAKTGTLRSVYTSCDLWERDETTDGGYDPAAFLEAAAPEMFAESGLCSLADVRRGDGAVYARRHDGYYFPENYLYVRMNPATGTVDEYEYVWDDAVFFAPSKDIVDESAAREAYVDALTLTLGYAAWPEGIDYDDPVLYRYADWGYTYVESLRLGYYYSGTEDVAGVDARTGEPITEKADGSFVYDDLTMCPVKGEIEALGSAGIGFAGGSFRPEAPITQRDALSLLVQAAGFDIRGWEDDTLRAEAIWQGFITADEWEPDRVLSGGDVVRSMLGASRYAAAAELSGVWAARFGDDGYAAAAAALGLEPIPAGACTRADAASLLYRFMSR